MGQDGVLHLDRGDVLAAPDDDVLGAVLDQDVAFLVESGHVAGVEPAVADGRGRCLRVAVVALHHHVRPDHDLADLFTVRSDVGAILVDDPQAHAGKRPAGHRLAFLAALRRLGLGQEATRQSDRQDRRGLGQPVADDRLHSERLLEAADQRG